MLPSGASNSIVPSDGLVVTPVTNEPMSGTESSMVCCMPAEVHVTIASSAPMVPLESAVSSRFTSSKVRSSFMPLASLS